MGQSLGASIGGPSWRCWVVVMLLTSSSDWGALVFGCMMHCVGDGSFSDHAWRPGMCATDVDGPCTRSHLHVCTVPCISRQFQPQPQHQLQPAAPTTGMSRIDRSLLLRQFVWLKNETWISVPHNPITPSFACSTQITKMVPKCRLRRPILALMPVPAQRRTQMVSYMLKRRRPKTKKRSGWMGIQCLRPRPVRSIVRRCPRLRPGPVDVRIGRARGCHGRHALQRHALRRHSLW